MSNWSNSKLEQMKNTCNIIKKISNMFENFTLKAGKETIHTWEVLFISQIFPILFNIFLNDLIWIFEIKQITTRAYEDDVVWISSNYIQLREAIDIMKIWWWENEMIINENKFEILRILKSSGTTRIIKNSLIIPLMKTYKYLGVVINQSLPQNTIKT